MYVKICGMKFQEDLLAAEAAGADFCGFIFHPASSRYISPMEAAKLNSGSMRRVGVFVDQNIDDIIGIAEYASLHLIQLHGPYSIEDAQKIGAERIIRVLWPQKYRSYHDLTQDLTRYSSSCAWYLLDAGSSGGTGKNLDWISFRDLVFPHPWFLAGGLNHLNISNALAACFPDGLDLNSGLELAPGKKCHKKIHQSCQAAGKGKK